MPRSPTEIRDRILKEWTFAAPGWRQWEPHIIAFTWPMSQAMLDGLQLRPGHRVLDVGCGIGDPAVAIAQKVGPVGRVIALDPTQEMLDTVRARAESLGQLNIEYRCATIEDAEFPAVSFDAIAGRWSFIFCIDVVEQFKRARAWLKPGGRIAVAAWTPQQFSPGFEAINVALNSVADLPPLDSTKPGRLQLSDPGQLEAALMDAGFSNVRVAPVQLSIFARDAVEFWRMSSEMGGSLQGVVRTLTDAQRASVQRDVAAAVEKFRANGCLRIPAQGQVAIGIRR